MQPLAPKQLGGEIYIEQANQIASVELRNKLQQLSTGRKNSPVDRGTKVGIAQPGKKPPIKGRKIENENPGGSKKTIYLAEFCVDMRDNSPNPNKQ